MSPPPPERILPGRDHLDELTGLSDREQLREQLDTRAQIARWDRSSFYLLSVEVPSIAQLRATLGSRAADAMALTLATRLRQQAGEHEHLARTGPGGLALLSTAVPAAPTEAARLRAQALLAALQAPMLLGETDVFPHCRIGVAQFPGDGDSGAALLEAAEQAGRAADDVGGVAFARPEANARALREMQLVGALRHAIEREELTLAYQPQVCLATGAIVGAEALARWRSPLWGDVSPAEFIPLAERFGLIGELGRWVLRQTCRQMVAWRQAGLPPLRLAVNISPLQLRDGDLAREVQQVLLDSGADPHALGIELTESAVTEDPARSSAMLRELRALGVEVALDDFGTGFSSLSCLRNLPIDVVKVDRSFVHDMGAAPESASVTRAIITMAHGLQMKVLAEGVETVTQLNQLLDKGCDLIQGYWFSPPVGPEALEALLREGRHLAPQHTLRRQHHRTLLLVDDEENILSALRRLFRRDGYTVLTATNAADALQRLAEQPVDVILSDQRMPGMTGVEFLHRAAALYPDTMRMTLSGFTDLQSIIDAVNEGAVYKFLTKPWEDERLRAHVAEAFRRKELADENRRLSDEVATANAELASVNARLSSALERQREQALLLQASVGGVRELLDDLPVAVVGLDPDGLLVYANAQAHRLFQPTDLALGMPALAEVAGLLERLSDQRPDHPLPATVNGRPCQVWRRALADGQGPARGQVLVCLPQPEETHDEPR